MTLLKVPAATPSCRWVWQGDGGRSELAGLLTIELTSMAGKPCLHTACAHTMCCAAAVHGGPG